MQFLPFKHEFFGFFHLQGSIFCIFDLLGMNFGNFHPWGWILCNFFSLRWILCNFYPLRLNSLQFLSLKGEIFAIFTLRFFLGEKDKKLLLYWWILWNFDFYFSDWGFFYLEFWVCVVLTQITRFLLGDLLRYVQKCAHRRKWQKWRLIAKIAKL